MSYIGTEPKDIRSFGRTKFDYTATQGQTAFTGADDDGKVLVLYCWADRGIRQRYPHG